MSSFLKIVSVVCVMGALVAPLKTSANTKITILHTSDIHSHFTSKESRRNLGGVARLKSKINQLRATKENTILLDAGDWSEGSIFFTLNSGEASEQLLQAFNYDAVVLGNHDWLVGPKQMYQTFKASDLKIPVLSANLDMSALPPSVPLSDFIKPYVIKEIGGLRVGIFGLSTFELLYDQFFGPVKLKEPFEAAGKMVARLRTFEKCDVVILLSHLGLMQDKLIAKSVLGIDMIVGGHTHLLMDKPLIVNGVPVLHVGQWGEYLGDYELTVDNKKKVTFTGHKIHQIDETIKEDAEIKMMVDGYIDDVELQFGSPVFHDQAVYSDVDIKIAGGFATNDVFGLAAVDAIRDSTDADIAIDSPSFSNGELFAGWHSTADLFFLFPHIYSGETKDAWTVHTYNLRGYTLKILLTAFAKFNMPMKMSNVELLLDYSKKVNLQKITVGGKPLNLLRSYKIASTPGILAFFKQLQAWKVPIEPTSWVDTKKPAWRVIAKKYESMSPIMHQNLKFEGRVQMVQPDIHIANEFLWAEGGDGVVKVKFTVINAGLTEAPLPTFHANVDLTPKESLDDQWESLQIRSELSPKTLRPGEKIVLQADWPLSSVTEGISDYPLIIKVDPVPGEVNLNNNTLETTLKINTLIDSLK